MYMCKVYGSAGKVRFLPSPIRITDHRTEKWTVNADNKLDAFFHYTQEEFFLPGTPYPQGIALRTKSMLASPTNAGYQN